MKKIYFLTLLSLAIFVSAGTLSAQEVIVTDDANYNSPASGSILDVKSTTKGLIIPRMTTAQRTTLGGNSPADGVVVYDTELDSFWYWDTDAWHQIAASNLDLTNVTFGAGSNYSTFEADGTLVFYGNATVWDDLQTPGLATQKGDQPPVLETFLNGTMIFAFEDKGTTNEEQVFFTVQFPHSWAGTAIYPHIHWSPQSDPGGNAVVRWGFEYTWVNYNSDTPLTFPATETLYVNAPCADNDEKKHLLASFGSITPTTSQDAISSMMVCRLFRNSGDDADTYNSKNAALLEFDIHYEKNTVGSRTDFVK